MRMSEELKLTIYPDRGKIYTVDFSEFALGGSAETVLKTTSWRCDYRGRPMFAREMYDYFLLENPSHSSAQGYRTGMRNFFRFLDTIDPEAENVRCSADVTDAHGPAFRHWLGGEDHSYRDVKSWLNQLRSLSGKRTLFWSARKRDLATREEPISDRAMKHFFHALRREAREITAMFAQGDHLALIGSDPRNEPDGWTAPENGVWLVKHMLQQTLPDKNFVDEAGARELREEKVTRPRYLFAGAEERSNGGLSGMMRWVVPGLAETAIFFWMFLVGTGWNYSTACAVDATDSNGWADRHPQSDKFTVIHAWKGRANRHQFTISLTRPEWHPFQVLLYILKRTVPLRNEVRRRLVKLRAMDGRSGARDASLMADIQHHEALLRSPWLYYSGKTEGRIGAFLSEGSNVALTSVARSLVETHGLLERHPELAEIVTSAVRHTWIGHAYIQSNYHVLLTQLASQHATVRTLKHYLRSRRYRAHSENQVRKLHDALFAEIAENRVVDPTRLRLLVEQGSIAPDQARRLADLRQRTRLGMGCIDPKAPPRSVSPDHRAGMLCRVQRCTGCENGIVFTDSVPALTRAYAELLHLRRSIPMTSWGGSSFEDEYESIGKTLEAFDTVAVAAQVADWTDKLRRGEIIAHGTYPSY
jgi:hypothetical protein